MAVIVRRGRQTAARSRGDYARLRESIGLVRRELEDLNYINLGEGDERDAGLEDDNHNRRERLRDYRIIRRRNPLAKNAAALLSHYVLGQGMTFRPNDKTLVKRILDEHIESAVNKVTLYSHQAEQEALDTVWTDGEMFLVLYPDVENGTVDLGHIDTLNVEDIILDSENRKVARWYKVKETRRVYNYDSDMYEPSPETNYVYYRDWRNDASAGERADPPKAKQRDGLIFHIAINKRGKRGESEMAAAAAWIKSHKAFMEDRSTINKAAASIAWKKKRKGPASDIAAEVQKIASGITATGGIENNPPPAAGSTIVENDASTLEWVKTDTGGSAALADERILRMMTGAGMGGIPNHYQGDEAAANLATATAMELPLLKTYEFWQKFWGDIHRDIFEFVLSTAHEAGRIGERDDSERYTERETTPQTVIQRDDALQEASSIKGDLTMVPREETVLGASPDAEPFGDDEEIDTTKPVDWYVAVDFPPIVQKDLTQWVQAMKELYAILPGANLESQKLVIEMFLTALGTDDVEQVMARLFPSNMAAVPVESTPTGSELANQIAQALGGAPSGLGKPPAAGAGAGMPPMPSNYLREAAEDDLTPLAEYRVRRLLREAHRAVVSDDHAAAAGG